MRHRIFETFTGPFALIEHDDGAITTQWVFPGDDLRRSRLDSRLQPALARQLNDYFAGDDVTFEGFDLPQGSAFHRACWKACQRIGRGRTISYGELARRAGSSPNAARAAGQAMRYNPLPIVTPCHRVVSAGGALHGFSGSVKADGPQVKVKRLLLEMESGSLIFA